MALDAHPSPSGLLLRCVLQRPQTRALTVSHQPHTFSQPYRRLFGMEDSPPADKDTGLRNNALKWEPGLVLLAEVAALPTEVANVIRLAETELHVWPQPVKRYHDLDPAERAIIDTYRRANERTNSRLDARLRNFLFNGHLRSPADRHPRLIQQAIANWCVDSWEEDPANLGPDFRPDGTHSGKLEAFLGLAETEARERGDDPRRYQKLNPREQEIVDRYRKIWIGKSSFDATERFTRHAMRVRHPGRPDGRARRALDISLGWLSETERRLPPGGHSSMYFPEPPWGLLR